MAASQPSDSDRKLRYMQAFRSLAPPTYAGGSDFLEAADWLRQVKKCMDFIDVPVEFRVALAAFMLTGEADHWWEFTQRVHDAGSLTWEDFEGRFRKMYFPNSFQLIDLSGKLFDLTQGDLTVAQYAAKFIHLSRFEYDDGASSMKGYIIRKFIRGLKPSIAIGLAAASAYGTFEDVVSMALMRETFEESRESREETSDAEASGSGGKFTSNRTSSCSNRYRPYNCYNCGKVGHIKRNCPDNQSSANYNGGC